MCLIPVFDKVAAVAQESDRCIGNVLGNICPKDLEEIRSLLFSPPLVVRRTLEVACLILNAKTLTGKPLRAPDWASVQRTLSDADFHARVLGYDVENLQIAPALCAYIMDEYFRPQSSSLPKDSARYSKKSRTSSTAGRGCSSRILETLTFARVQRASQAASALFRWCFEMIDTANTTNEAANTTMDVNTTIGDVAQPLEIPVIEPLKRAVSRTEAKMQHGQLDRATSFKRDRYFECLVAFRDGAHCLGPQQVAQLRKVATAMRKRPALTLHLAECSIRPGADVGKQQVYSAQLFFDAENIPYTCVPAERNQPGEIDGILCAMHVDEELLTCIESPCDSADPACPNAHSLRRCMADGNHVCSACGEEMGSRRLFYRCECHSLCCTCYHAALNASNTDLRKVAKYLSMEFRMNSCNF